MNIKEKSVQAAISAFLAALAGGLGILAVPIIVLLIMMILDWGSGMAAAWVTDSLSSKTGGKGVIKKVGYMGLIIVASGLDYLVFSGIDAVGLNAKYGMWFGLTVAIWLIINEMISILENLSKLGVPIPDFLTKIISKLKISTENKYKSEDDKHD